MTHGSLFSGIGGFEIGADRAGLTNIWNCEIEPFQRGVLRKKFPNTTHYEDIRKMHNPRYVDVISGGFPCQDISVAGGGGQVSTAKDLAFGVRCIALWGTLDHDTSSLKTAQTSLFEDSKKSYATFPKSGMMRNGNVYLTSLLDTHIKEKGFTLLPTPTKSDYKATFLQKEALDRYLESGHQIRLMDILAQKGFTKCQRVMIFEMVMGFDIGHTELEVSEIPLTQP